MSYTRKLLFHKLKTSILLEHTNKRLLGEFTVSLFKKKENINELIHNSYCINKYYLNEIIITLCYQLNYSNNKKYNFPLFFEISVDNYYPNRKPKSIKIYDWREYIYDFIKNKKITKDIRNISKIDFRDHCTNLFNTDFFDDLIHLIGIFYQYEWDTVTNISNILGIVSEYYFLNLNKIKKQVNLCLSNQIGNTYIKYIKNEIAKIKIALKIGTNKSYINNDFVAIMIESYINNYKKEINDFKINYSFDLIDNKVTLFNILN